MRVNTTHAQGTLELRLLFIDCGFGNPQQVLANDTTLILVTTGVCQVCSVPVPCLLA